MKIKLFFFLFFPGFSSFAQYTLIPDVNFEKELIAKGIDTDGLNGKVSTFNINTVPYLNVSSRSINDLTGIQDFTALRTLLCYANKLASLNLSKNINLDYLDCSFNILTNLDLSKNTALSSFFCDSNQLMNLDVSNNTVLKDLHCGSNRLTSLDVTNNRFLESLTCYSNQLTSLNLKNGNNFILFYGDVSVHNTDFKNNPNLRCIEVDDVTFSNANWETAKDVEVSYSTSCPSLGIAETIFDEIIIYPNPSKGEVHIDNSILKKATLYDVLGKLVKTTTFVEGFNSNIINLTDIPIGIYYIYLEIEETTVVKKIILK